MRVWFVFVVVRRGESENVTGKPRDGKETTKENKRQNKEAQSGNEQNEEALRSKPLKRKRKQNMYI